MKHADVVSTEPAVRLFDRLPEPIKRKLEGENAWGYFEVAPLSRGLWMRERLTVFPPGTTAAECRAVVLHRNWPVVGAVVALFAMIGFGVVLAPFGAFLVAFALYGVGILLSARATHRVRRESVRLVVITVAVSGGASSYGNVQSMSMARSAFESLDIRARDEDLTPAQYEREWASIFQALKTRGAALSAELERGIGQSSR